MKKFLKAFRHFRGYTRKYGGAIIFWNEVFNKWQAAPIARVPEYLYDAPDGFALEGKQTDKNPTFIFE